MLPVDQEFFYDKGEIGDCVRAVTASILELSPTDVPHFVKNQPEDEWYDTWEQFMVAHGVKPIMIISGDIPPRPRGYYLASGPADRGCKHIVIMNDGKLVHDPHPSRAGLTKIEVVWMLKYA
jgi:hypothetical protein